jgi:hypothetical protein
MQVLCIQCHNAKTRNLDQLGKDRVPVKGVDAATGLPLDPTHWWRRK